MRLIDADKIIENLEKGKKESESLVDVVNTIGFQAFIDSQPTACDLDEIVDLIDQGKYLLNMSQLLDYLNTIKQEHQQATKVLGASIKVDPMTSSIQEACIQEACIERELASKMVDKLINDGALKITKEICPESGKTMYRCKLELIERK